MKRRQHRFMGRALFFPCPTVPCVRGKCPGTRFRRSVCAVRRVLVPAFTRCDTAVSHRPAARCPCSSGSSRDSHLARASGSRVLWQLRPLYHWLRAARVLNDRGVIVGSGSLGWWALICTRCSRSFTASSRRLTSCLRCGALASWRAEAGHVTARWRPDNRLQGMRDRTCFRR